MIYNVVLHIANEQPLVVDLYDMPTPSDVSLLCTNVRMLGGRKPVFIDHTDSVFVFPYVTIRFIELPAVVPDGVSSDGNGVAIASGAPAPAADADDGDLELDEDFLRRVREV